MASEIETSNQTWRIIAASVCGSSHERDQQPGQDSFCWNILTENILVAAVADGASSAELGGIGATIAVQAVTKILTAFKVVNSLASTLDNANELMTEVFQHARLKVEQEAVHLKVDLRQLATTLIVVIATQQEVIASQIGDGGAVARDTDGTLFSLTVPDNGEYANETTFLTAPYAMTKLQTKAWHGKIAQIALFSDGLQRLALTKPTYSPHVPFFNPMLRFAAEADNIESANTILEDFLRSPRVRNRTDDDATLLLASLNR